MTAVLAGALLLAVPDSNHFLGIVSCFPQKGGKFSLVDYSNPHSQRAKEHRRRSQHLIANRSGINICLCADHGDRSTVLEAPRISLGLDVKPSPLLLRFLKI